MIAQTPWTERKFEFDFPVGAFPIIVERLRGTPIRLRSMLKNVIAEKLQHKTADKWSLIEQVNHLCNCEEVWYGRVDDFLSGQGLIQKRVLKTELISDNIEVLLQCFSEARRQFIVKLENMDEGTASLGIIHPRLQKPIRLIDSLFSTAEHDDHHLAKIRELLR